ncbi:glycine-rich cell wall structural protein 1-like isoform X4 [Daphnia pulex]|uniref:glycine-rich cell wall structural protein 1-like isoform X4 n=1 Tax=Daphnia pulex TaxID=6669 RepID=UPI001EE151ED|nr:glycine-rich cell wall structural protein 1-like isoform X4 [Daphnia pulex]
MFKQTIFILVVVAMVGSALGRPQRPQRPNRPIAGGFLPGAGLGGANAAGLGSGSVVGNQAIGQGTGIANAGQGGFGIGLGVGGAVATPLGNLAFGQGESISVGK